MINWIFYQDVVQTRILDLLLTLENENLNLKASRLSDDELQLTQQEEKSSSLSSLKMIHIEDDDLRTNINTIDQILGLKWIKKQKIYVNMVFEMNESHSKVFQESFKKLCQTVSSLLISHEIPIKLHITINEMEKSHFKKTYYPIFQQYLNQDLLKNCNAPIVNKYCTPLSKPVISLTFEQNDEYDNEDDDNESYVKMRFQVSTVTKNFEYIS